MAVSQVLPWGAREDASAVALLRDIFGPLPFRPVTFDPACRTPTVLARAGRAYLERRLPACTLDASLMRVLADALGEAGCNGEEVLAHLRSRGPHARGSWPVDLVLEKD